MTSNLAAANSAAHTNTQKNRKKTAIALMTAALLILSSVFGAVLVHAGANAGIKNNGTSGISIDIYGPYYKALAKETSSAYVRGGCAWYASARASELVGRNLGVHSPSNWWNSIAASNGFKKTSSPVAKGFAIYSNHMVVIEKLDGNTVTISEGSNPGASDAAHGYCALRQVSLSSLKNLYSGQSFKGFIDLGVYGANPPIPSTVPASHGEVYVAKGIADNTWHSYRNTIPDYSYTGVAKGIYGWWRIVNGYVDWNANSVYKNENGWWKTSGGKVDFDYNGLASNENGTWYIAGGRVDFTYNGELTVDGTVWTIMNGRATVKA